MSLDIIAIIMIAAGVVVMAVMVMAPFAVSGRISREEEEAEWRAMVGQWERTGGAQNARSHNLDLDPIEQPCGANAPIAPSQEMR